MESIAAKLVGAVVALILLAVVVPKLFSRTARMRRRLRAAEQKSIRDLAESAAVPQRIAGMVVPVGETLIAPLSGRACVYYETRAVRAIGWAILSSDVEYEIAVEKQSTPFVIDDATGTAFVDPTEAEALLGTDVDRWSHDDDADPAAESAFLARFGQGRRGLLFEKRLHFTESIIEVGERIAVTGLALYDRNSPAPTAPYRHFAQATPPRMAGTPRNPLLITDDPVFTPPLEATRGNPE